MFFLALRSQVSSDPMWFSSSDPKAVQPRGVRTATGSEGEPVTVLNGTKSGVVYALRPIRMSTMLPLSLGNGMFFR